MRGGKNESLQKNILSGIKFIKKQLLFWIRFFENSTYLTVHCVFCMFEMFFRKFGNLHKVERSYQKCFGQRLLSGLGICSSVFWANCSFFAKKWANERLAKTTRDLLIPSIFGWYFLVSDLSELLMVAHCWWATWAIRSHHSFLVSDLSNLLTSLIKKGENEKIAR